VREQQGTGMSISDISQITGVNQTEIRRAVDFLSGEGHLYCTIDEGNSFLRYHSFLKNTFVLQTNFLSFVI
jgi:hypothetical protein